MIEYRVQHFPGRASIARLLEQLPPTVTVIEDSESPWAGYRRCLQDISEDYCVILQDDVTVCADFTIAVEKIAAARPDSVVLLFMSGLRQRTQIDFLRAQTAGERFCNVFFRDIHNVCGVLWPRAAAEEFLQWTTEHKIPGRQPPKSDDAALGFWARMTHRQVLCSVPCIVQHPDDAASTIGRTAHNGKDKGRVAISFDENAAALDW